MKRIRVVIETLDGQEILKIDNPLFVGIVADRFVIEDRRTPIKKPPAQEAKS